MTATSIDEDILVLLDFEPQDSCETQWDDCPKTPTWTAVSRCCNEVRRLCTEHKERNENRLRDVLDLGLFIYCPYCFTTMKTKMWDYYPGA